MRKRLQFKQLVSNDTTLTGLADNGSVWVYLGASFGWTEMNMNVMSKTDLARYKKQKWYDNRMEAE